MGTVFLSSGLEGGSGGLPKGEHWIMVYEYRYEHGYEKRKDQRTESQTEGKIQYLLLPVLVAWNTLTTRGSTASRRHIEILKSYNSLSFDVLC